jgi:dedicator of cytokinesis protein 3
MLDRHPAALLLKSSSIPQDDIQFSEAPYLQVTGVNPDPDRPSSTIFTNPDVPSAVRQYYERNETPFFCFTRPINKDGEVNEFMSLWTEKTVSSPPVLWDDADTVLAPGTHLRGLVPLRTPSLRDR